MAVRSPWAVFPYLLANSSFNEAIEVPPTDIDVGPFVCAPIPVAWLQAVVGALSQLRMPVAWVTATEAEVQAVMANVDQLIANIALASMCEERGAVSITILAGAASANLTVTFPTAFTTIPVVVCSCENPVILASPSSRTTTNFVATVTSATPVLVNTTVEFLWEAGPAS